MMVENKQQTTNNNNRGFTLVEMLISIAVIAVVGVLGGDILIASVRSYNKSQTINQLTQNGDFALSQMTESLRNASVINQVVTNLTSSSISYVDQFGNLKTYNMVDGSVSCSSNDNGSLNDNTNQLLNTNISNNPTARLIAGSFVASTDLKLVTISMTLGQPCSNGTRIDNTATTTLTTTVVVRGGYQ
ncbi:MAG: type II secretion system protein [candidate division WWE3 bacterium]|nr:type II secretion system protein [candidate division WWE3 bacterium]